MRKKLIKISTELRLLACGLSLELNIGNNNLPNPRADTLSIFVGGEVAIPLNVDKGENITEFVANYCRDILKCQSRDLVWAMVRKHENNGVEFSICDTADKWDNSIIGFIYLTKKHLYQAHDISRISQSIYSRTIEDFKAELTAYTSWCRDEVFDVKVVNKKISSCKQTKSILNRYQHVDYATNQLINKFVALSAAVA